MKKIIKITESDLAQIVKKVLNEQKYVQSSSVNFNPKNLKFGDRGDDVKVLQQKLMDGGYLRTDSMVPTGYFGNLTNRALQSAMGGAAPFQPMPFASKPGAKQQPQTKTTLPPKQQPKKEPGKTTPSAYTFTPRIDQELKYIKERGLGDSPFFIYDPKDNLIFLFENADKFVAKSQVVDGADMQREAASAKVMTIDDWCKASGLDSTPYTCTNPQTKEKKDPYYSVMKNLKERFLPKGIYKISSLARNEGYVGGGNNEWSLKDNEGKVSTRAIHGIPNLPDRLKASKELESLLKSDMDSGKVPQEYLNAVKQIANANLSFGCVGVPAKFVDNPQVKSILETGDKWYKKSVKVFVMGDTGKDYLAQNSVQFFDKLSSDGQNCQNPLSVAQNVATLA
jgi:peptidoglycan hydrolase-like protein with peptidoglycan-binding domain